MMAQGVINRTLRICKHIRIMTYDIGHSQFRYRTNKQTAPLFTYNILFTTITAQQPMRYGHYYRMKLKKYIVH